MCFFCVWSLCFVLVAFSCLGKNVYLVLSCTLGIARRSLGLTPGYQSGFIHGIFVFNNKFGFWGSTIIFLWNWKPWMFSEDYKRSVCLDVGNDWNALIYLAGLIVQILNLHTCEFGLCNSLKLYMSGFHMTIKNQLLWMKK